MTPPILRPGPSRRTSMVIFTAVAMALLAIGYWNYRKETEKVLHEKHEEIAAIGELKAGQIQQWRKERLADAARFAKGHALKQSVADYLRDPASPAHRTDLLEQLQLDRMVDQYHEVLLFTADAKLALSTEAVPAALEPATQQAVMAALASQDPVLSDLFQAPDGIVCIDAVAGMRDERGQPMAALVLRSHAKAYLFPLIKFWPTPSSTAETLLVRRDGEEAVYLNDLRHETKAALTLRIPLNQADHPAVQALLGKTGLVLGKDYRGVRVMADLRQIPGSPWFMVAKMDADEVLAETRYRAGMISFVVGSLILFAAAATAYVYRHRQAGLFRELYDSERQQREAQETFRTTLYSIGDAVITTDQVGSVREMNPAAEKLTGWLEAEARGEPLEQVFRIIKESSRATAESPLDQVLRTGAVVGLADHILLIAKDGTERPIADSAAPIHDEEGAITGVVLVFTDQSDKHAAQKELRTSEGHLRAIIASEPECVKLIDADGKLLEMNPAGLAMLEAESFAEVQKLGLMAFVHPEFHAAFRTLHERVMRGESGMLEFEVTGLKGAHRWLETHAVPLRDAEEQPPMLLGITRDITERKAAEAALVQRSQQLAELSMATQLINTVLEAPAVLRQLVATALRITGGTDGAAALLVDGRMVFKEYNLHGKLMPIDFQFEAGYGVPGWVMRTREPYLSNDAKRDPHVVPDIQRALGFLNLADVPIINRQGELLGCFEIHNKPDGFNSTDILMLRGLAASTAIALENSGLLDKIRKAEEEARAASQKLALHFEQSPLAVIEWDLDFRVVRWNPAAERMFGYTAQDALGQHGLFIVPESDRAQVEPIMANLLKGEGSQRSANRNIRRDGAVITCDWHNTSLIDAEGCVVGVASQVQDISDRKFAEERIQRLTQLYLALSQCNQAIVRAGDEQELFPEICRGVVSLGGMKMAWIGMADPATRRIVPVASFGDHVNYLGGIQISMDADDPLGRGPTGTALREDQPFWCQDYQRDPAMAPWLERATASGWRSSAALPLHRNGRAVGVLTIYSGHIHAFDEEAKTLLLEMAADISHALDTFAVGAERERAEAALQESEGRFRTLVEWTPEPFCVHRDGKFIYANPAALRMFGATSAQDLLGKPILDRVHPEFRQIVLERLKNAPDIGGIAPMIEEKFLRLDGTAIDVEAQATLIVYGGAPAVHVAIRDITERKRADESLRASLREKEALLKEVHHRVKNNLQVITSLLRLEAGKSAQPDTKSVLREMQNRIRSMALLHETLYRSENLEQVDLPAYIKQLTTHLFRSMLAEPGHIQLRLDLAPITLSLEQAVPCGLLVNELVSNCLKHGFPDGCSGEVHIEAAVVEAGKTIRLRVSDNGIGLPLDFEEKRMRSLGMQLVSDLAKQLKGHLEASGGPGLGANFEVSFGLARPTAAES